MDEYFEKVYPRTSSSQSLQIIIIIISIIILVTIIVTVIIFMNIVTRPIQIFTDWHYPLMKSLRALRSKRSLKNSISGAIHIYLEC